VKRELVVTADGRDHTVIVDGPGEDGRFRISIDGAEQRVDARALRPGTWSLVITGTGGTGGTGKSYVVDLDRRRTGIVASVGDSETMLQVEDALHKRLASAAGTRPAPRGEALRAPIAGKVVKVLVAVGDHVAAGTAVIVLEAMKMENELAAERGGTVSAIHKAAGQAVDTGDLLVEIV
jgi:acetyl-CoA/propionyl-CoA carboxylase biotin carboxyl carrier protein